MESPSGSVLVLNQNYEPLNICNVRRAMILLWLGKAEVVKTDSAVFHTIAQTFEVPSVVRLSYFVKRPVPQLKLSRKSILARDDHTCQYCGFRGSNLTLDHVVPKHRGGATDWHNLVCCCLPCNNKKGNRTPQEAGMKLRRQPKKPRYVPYISFSRFVTAARHEAWREFLQPYTRGLDLPST